jgi:hypothetical protein
MPNEFAELYKTYSTKELVDVISRKDDYQAEAVIAAQNELDSRNVSADVIIDYNSVAIASTNKNHWADFNLQNIKERLLTFPNENNGTIYLINGLSILLLIEYLLNYWSFYIELFSFLTYGIFPDFTFAFFIAFVITKLVFIGLFWQREVVGWVGVSAWSIYGFLHTIVSIYYTFIEPTESPKISTLFPENTGESFLFWLLFYGGLAYIIHLKHIRNIYKANEWITVLSIVLPILFLCRQLFFT